jgi:hypothetical protein
MSIRSPCLESCSRVVNVDDAVGSRLEGDENDANRGYRASHRLSTVLVKTIALIGRDSSNQTKMTCFIRFMNL